MDSVVGAGNMDGSFLKGRPCRKQPWAVERRVSRLLSKAGQSGQHSRCSRHSITRMENSFYPSIRRTLQENHEVYSTRDMLGDEA
jgi:hypothetical protein